MFKACAYLSWEMFYFDTGLRGVFIFGCIFGSSHGYSGVAHRGTSVYIYSELHFLLQTLPTLVLGEVKLCDETPRLWMMSRRQSA